MKIKLLTFTKPLTKKEIRNDLPSPEAWHERAREDGSTISTVGIECCGMAMMEDDEQQLRLMLICEDGSAAIDIQMGEEASGAMLEAIETGRAHMMAQALMSFVDEVGETKLKEASDIVAAGMFGGMEPGES